mgnify:CR=1 FL=1
MELFPSRWNYSLFLKYNTPSRVIANTGYIRIVNEQIFLLLFMNEVLEQRAAECLLKSERKAERLFGIEARFAPSEIFV